MQKISAKLLRVEKLANNVYEFEFAPSREAGGDSRGASEAAGREALDFKAGQFMLLNVPAGDDGTMPPVSRAYSVASAPGDATLLFCVKLIPGGRGSEYFRSLKVGDTVELQGPSGHLLLKPSEDTGEESVIMVATGVGIAPFMSILKQMFADGDTRKTFLHFGVRHEDDIFYKEQLDAWKTAHENFDFTLTLSKPSEDWTGAKGRVTEHLAKHLETADLATTEFFICGNGAMVKEAKTMAEERGFTKDRLHFELFTPILPQ